jgi:hypothetical protein
MSYDTGKTPDSIRESNRRWREHNADRMKEIRASWKASNRDRHRENQRNHRYTVRREILTMICGALKCQSCGYDTDWRALQIDHIHGGGRHDPRTSGGNTNLWSLRNWIKQFPDAAKAMYQVLCANCNRIKVFECGEQPGGIVKKDAT